MNTVDNLIKRADNYCQNNNIPKYSFKWYVIKNAFIYKENALSYNNIEEIGLTSRDKEDFYKQIELTYPYNHRLLTIKLNRDLYERLIREKAREVWRNLMGRDYLLKNKFLKRKK